MEKVYLASVGERSGKTVISLGLAMNYPGKAGFYKPFRESLTKNEGEEIEQDALLMSEVLGLGERTKLSPFSYDIFNPVSMEEIVAGYEELCKGKELMILEGSKNIASGRAHNLSHFDIAEAVGAPLILVSTPSHQCIDNVFIFKELCDRRKLNMLGVILNRAEGGRERKFIENRGIRVLGEVPLIPELRTFKVSEISEIMDAKVLAGAEGMDNIVETMSVGAMSIQTAVRYMRRSRRKAVITGGDRTEIQLAALSTDTSCIIVTGGIRPSYAVISRANQINVPILLTEGDTLQVTEMIEHLIARIDPTDKEKIELVRKKVRHNVDLDRIW
ncbi:MAG: phosphotransacetylase family protein [Methanomassiliicoccaceae archaeon]|nr:phosphotransacetylase family protein [Methanomassiliicoccaceae archaeon]